MTSLPPRDTSWIKLSGLVWAESTRQPPGSLNETHMLQQHEFEPPNYTPEDVADKTTEVAVLAEHGLVVGVEHILDEQKHVVEDLHEDLAVLLLMAA